MSIEPEVSGRAAMPALKLLVLGDSIALGLGANAEPFPVLLERELGSTRPVELWNAALNGASSLTHLARLDDYLAYRPNVVVIHLGSIDALLAPRRDRGIDLVGWLPHRYQQPGWLQPRPYLPSRWWKRVFYAIPESYIRVRVGRLLMRLLGGIPYVEPGAFSAAYERLVSSFRRVDATCVVCGIGPIDPDLFPGTDESFPHYRRILSSIAAAYGCRYVDLDRAFAPARHHRQGLLLLDNFHPNSMGHRAIARALLPAVVAAAAGRAIR